MNAVDEPSADLVEVGVYPTSGEGFEQPLPLTREAHLIKKMLADAMLAKMQSIRPAKTRKGRAFAALYARARDYRKLSHNNGPAPLKMVD